MDVGYSETMWDLLPERQHQFRVARHPPGIGERHNKTFPSGELRTASLHCGKSRLSCATLNYESNAGVPCA